jgi:hypothetical protein
VGAVSFVKKFVIWKSWCLKENIGVVCSGGILLGWLHINLVES